MVKRLIAAGLILWGIVSLAHSEITSILTIPGGTNGAVQFNKRFIFGGEPDFTYSTATKTLSVSSMSATHVRLTSLAFADGTSMTTAASGSGGITVLSTMTAGATNFVWSQIAGVQTNSGFWVSTGIVSGPFTVFSRPAGGFGAITSSITFNMANNSFDPTGHSINLDSTGNRKLRISKSVGGVEEFYWIMGDSAFGTVFEVGDGSSKLSITGSAATLDVPLTISTLDCTGNVNGGALTADAAGLITCSDDDSGAGGGGITPNATFYIIQGDTLQSGATFYVSSGTVSGNNSFYLNGTGGSSNSRIMSLFTPLPRSGGFGPQTQEAVLYGQTNQHSSVSGNFYVVASTMPPNATNPISSASGNSVAFNLSPMGGDDNLGFVAVELNGSGKLAVYTGSTTISNVLTVAGSTFSINGVLYHLLADGSADQILKTDGSGNLSFTDDQTGGGGASSLEVFSTFDAESSSPTASIGIGDSLKLTVTGSTAVIAVDFSSVASLANLDAYQPLDATLTDLAAAPLGEDNSIGTGALAAGALPTDVTVVAANMADADHGDVTWASSVASVEDDSHAHTSASLSGIDISADTNLTAGTNITLTGDDLSVDDAFILNTGDTGTGIYDFGGATSFALPNGANPTIDAIGKFGVDSSSGQGVFFDGANAIVLSSTKTYAFNLSTPVAGNYPLGVRVPADTTISSIVCISSAATSTTVILKDCNAGGSSCNTIEAAMTCGTTETVIPSGGIDSATVQAGRYIRPFVSATSGSPGWVGVYVYYREKRN